MSTVRVRVFALITVLVLVLAACGSRSDDGESGDPEESNGESSGLPIGEDSPCSDGDAGGATDVGVTDDSITIGTIQDVGGELRPDLMIGPRQAVEAFVAYCNSQGGINGRELVLNEYDSALLEHGRAAEEACAGDNFALVGSASAQDNQGTQTIVDCGLPMVPTFTATAAHADSDLMVQPIPNPTYQYGSGPCAYIAENYPDAVAAGGLTFSDYPVTIAQAERQIAGCGTHGFATVSEQATNPIGESDWLPKLQTMSNAGARYYTHWGEKEDFAQAIINAKQQNIEFDVIEAGPQMYDPGFIEVGGADVDGTLIWMTVVPLEEVDDTPEMRVYFDWLEETSGGEPTALGIQSWSSMLLFAESVKALGSDVTRDALMDELYSVTEWDGHGLHHTTNPGENLAANCFVYVRAEEGGFVRHYPDEGFDCDDAYRVDISGDWGEGAKVSG